MPRLHRTARRHCSTSRGEHPPARLTLPLCNEPRHGGFADIRKGSDAMDYLLPPELVNKARDVLEKNRAAGRTIALAESCTGGLVSAALTEIAGSSDVFLA